MSTSHTLGVGTAQAAPGPDGTVRIGSPNDRSQARVFNPQPGPPAFSHPGNRTGLGGPDTIPSPQH